MRQLFVLIIAVLTLASFYTYGSLSSQLADRPIVSWSSDANTQRFEQVELFHQWLVKNGHTAPDGGPAIRMNFEGSGGQLQSAVIQAVSGVAADILDHTRIDQFGPMGVLYSLEKFKTPESAWTLDKTYPAAADMLTHNGEQLGYACNAYATSMIFNMNALRRVGMGDADVPEFWTPETFEAFAKTYVERANQGLARREYFMGSGLDGGHGEAQLHVVVRSQGIDLFNETGTVAQCADPRFAAVIKRFHKWTFEDRIYPTAADTASMSGQSGFGGVEFSQFLTGRYATLQYGRWIVVRTRDNERSPGFAGPVVHLRSATLPSYNFKNVLVGMRISAIYAGCPRPELAKLFIDFLADREYNEYIVEHGDGLPPNPQYALTNPNYLEPPGFEHEGNIHANEINWALTIGLRSPFSPYFKAQGQNLMSNAISRVFNNLQTVEESLAEAQDRHNRAIQDTLEANPYLRAQYAEDLKKQAVIDGLKARGEKIPASLISNSYYLSYYRHTGQLLEDTPDARAGDAQ